VVSTAAGDGPGKRLDGFARSLAYQVHPDHAGLVDEVIDWYDGSAADVERTVMPSAADEFALKRWAAHGYETDPASLGDTGSWIQLNERDLTDLEQPVLPDGSGSAPPTRPGRWQRSRPIWMPGLPRRIRPRATGASGRRRGTAATCNPGGGAGRNDGVLDDHVARRSEQDR
jgi:hypothetical protein